MLTKMIELEDCGLLVIDIQGKLAELVHNSDSLLSYNQKLIRICKTLEIPIIAVEQNPQGLGRTHPQLLAELDGVTFYEKSHFSALLEPTIVEALKASGKKHWLVTGIESHICVYQTVLGLVDQGYNVDVVTDCISSRAFSNVELAIANMRALGVSMTSVEMITYQLLKTSEHHAFRDILKIVK